MTPTASEKAEKALRGRTILVVDDEPDQLVFIATLLEDHGATTLRAQNADQALDLAQQRPSLITLDLAMPGKSGVEVFGELRQNESTSSIPVCIVTGHPEMRKLVYERAPTRPPEGYLDKPVNGEVLLTTIRRVLEMQTRAQERQKTRA